MMKFKTLENLSLSSPDLISKTLGGIKIETAKSILHQAREVYEKQKAVKEKEMLSLDAPGTTKEKAARYKMNQDLAKAALEVAEDDL